MEDALLDDEAFLATNVGAEAAHMFLSNTSNRRVAAIALSDLPTVDPVWRRQTITVVPVASLEARRGQRSGACLWCHPSSLGMICHYHYYTISAGNV